MSIETAGTFLQTLQRSRLFNEPQLQHLATIQHLAPAEQLQQLTICGWTTPWQAQRLAAGQSVFHLGRYRMLSEAGRGNTGVVFQALDERAQRVVAVKLIHPHLVGTPDDVQRLLWHVKQASQLDHPNLACPRDADAAGSKYFVVFDYFEGKNFAASLKAYGKPSLEWSCEAVRQAAGALQLLHERGVVHGDVRPTHLFDAAPPGETRPFVKVLGGGMTFYDPLRLPQTETPPPDAKFLSSDFLPPERLMGAAVDARTDLYSLGCVLYTLLTGEPPFPGADPMERLRARTAVSPAPVRKLREEASPELEAVVARLTALDPRMRYQSAAEAASALAICMSLPSFHTQKTDTYKLAGPETYKTVDTISESSAPTEQGPPPPVYYPVPTAADLAKEDRARERSRGGGGMGGNEALGGAGVIVLLVILWSLKAFVRWDRRYNDGGYTAPPNSAPYTAPAVPGVVEGPSGRRTIVEGPGSPPMDPRATERPIVLPPHLTNGTLLVKANFVKEMKVIVNGATYGPGGGSRFLMGGEVRVTLPAGSHSVRVEGLDSFGRPVYSDATVNIVAEQTYTLNLH